MSCEVHVRFCEGVGVQFPRATHHVVGFQQKEDASGCLRICRSVWRSLLSNYIWARRD